MDNPILKFLFDLVSQDVALKLLTGFMLDGFIFAVMWLFGKEAKPVIEKSKRIWLAALGLLVGFFAIQTFTVASRQLARIIAPTPPSAVRASVVKCSPFENPTGSLLAFYLRLTNPGKPTTLWNWKIRVILREGQQFEFNAADFSEKATFKGRDSNSNVFTQTILAADYLPNQLFEKGVGPDRGAVGWVLFPISLQKSYLKPGTKYVIEFEQADGSKRSLEHIWYEPVK
jgi:hypothetical protein